MICAEIHAPRSPVGFRRTTPAGRATERLADAFLGLPEGVSRWRLAAATRAAARKLGLNASMLALIEHYIDISYDIDWTAGSEPVITRPLVEIAEHMGKSERQVRNIEQALADRGLLVWRDSGNHHRKGRRDRESGRLRYAYGPSLAPLAARAGEIIALAAEARRELAEIRRLRIAISALRRRFRAEMAELPGEGAAGVAAAQAEFLRLPERNPARTSVGDLRAQLARLKAILETLREAGEQSPDPSPDTRESSGTPEIFGRHSSDTSKEKSMNGSVKGAGKKLVEDNRADRIARRGATRRPQEDRRDAPAPISIHQARDAAGPRMRFFLDAFAGRTGWPDLVAAAEGILQDIGVSRRLWGEACGLLGRNGAALAILVVERGVDRKPGSGTSPVANPEAYLRAMMDRAKAGKLHLHRSIFALAREAPG